MIHVSPIQLLNNLSYLLDVILTDYPDAELLTYGDFEACADTGTGLAFVKSKIKTSG